MLNVPAIHFTFLNSDMSVVELLNGIIIFFRHKNRVKARPKFLTTKERGLVLPAIAILTDRNMVIVSTFDARTSTKISRQIIHPFVGWNQGGRSRRRYRGPRRLRQRNERLRTINNYRGSILKLDLRDNC
jgi:hypothetical protein